MAPTLTTYLRLLKPYLPEILLESNYLKRIEEICEHLPVLSYGFFECHFGNDQRRFDFNISISGYLMEHVSIYSWYRKSDEFPNNNLKKYLNEAERFLSSWVKENFKLKLFVDHLWLSFDVDLTKEIDDPWYYVSFTDNHFNKSSTFKTVVICEVLRLLEDPILKRDRQKLVDFLNAVPDQIVVKSIGSQKKRKSDLLRVYLVFQSYSNLFDFLINNKWPGDVVQLRSDMDNFFPGSNLYGLLIDLSPDLQPKIGVEIWFDNDGLNPGLVNMMNKLVDKKLCTQAEALAFTNWEGQFSSSNEPNIWSWPESYTNLEINFPQTVKVQRMARYVKFVYEPGNSMSAKGYFGFNRSL